jgi:hypothetical protein
MRNLTWLPLGCCLVFGCSADPVTVATSPKGLTRIATLDATTLSLMYAAASPFRPITESGVTTAENAAAAAAAAAPQLFSPSSCVGATASGATTSYHLDSCTGPLGVTNMTGDYVASYQAATNAVQITVQSTRMEVEGIPMTVDAQGLFTEPGSGLQLDMTSHGSAPGDEYVISQALTMKLNWHRGDTCATAVANGTLTINDATFQENMSGITLCANQCPSTSGFAISDGTATLATVTFNGTSEAVFITPANHSGSVTLACVPAQ